MESKKPSIRPLKKDDITEFYPEQFPYSIRGITIELDEKPVAIAGVIHTSPLQAFSIMKDPLRKYPKTIIKAARKLKDIMNKYETTIYAIADEDESNSCNFLKHIGFVETGDDGVYKWVS